MNTNYVFLYMILGICSLFLHKYFLSKYTIPKTIKWIIYVLIVVVVINGALVIFTNFYDDKISPWHVRELNYSALHRYSQGQSEKIAIIDSGFSSFQEDLVTSGIYLINSSIHDKNGHGTAILSIIKGYDDKILGIAPASEIVVIKVMDQEENITPTTLTKAVETAIEHNCTVINFSLGSYKFNQEIADSLNDAISKGITVIASSGDYGTEQLLFPATFDNVISVGSIAANGLISDFSNGSEITTINAPGEDIQAISVSKQQDYFSGTSYATALMSGYVALLKDYASKNDKTLSINFIKNILEDINTGKIMYKDAFKKIDNI